MTRLHPTNQLANTSFWKDGTNLMAQTNAEKDIFIVDCLTEHAARLVAGMLNYQLSAAQLVLTREYEEGLTK
jgi:hypothetical protein